jgi:hypothetical protein
MPSGAVAEPIPQKVPDVAKKKGGADEKPKGTALRVFAVRLPPDIAARVEKASDGLGLDEASFLRMLTVENLPTYEKRVERIKAGYPGE